VSRDKVVDYIEAVFSVMLGSVDNLVGVIAHPLDNLVYPMSSLMYDATIVASGMLDSAGRPFCMGSSAIGVRTWLKENPGEYEAAWRRIDARARNINDEIARCRDGDGPTRVEVAGKYVADYLTFGFVFKTASNIASNISNFGSFTAPKSLQAIAGEVKPALYDKWINAIQIHDLPGSFSPKHFMYMIDDSLKVWIMPRLEVLSEIEHIRYLQSKTGVKHVFASGELLTENGKIFHINNLKMPGVSGSIYPYKNLVEKAFKQGTYDAFGVKLNFDISSSIFGEAPAMGRAMPFGFSHGAAAVGVADSATRQYRRNMYDEIARQAFDDFNPFDLIFSKANAGDWKPFSVIFPEAYPVQADILQRDYSRHIKFNIHA